MPTVGSALASTFEFIDVMLDKVPQQVLGAFLMWSEAGHDAVV